MSIDMSQFYQVFFEEAGENLTAMESLLLELDVQAPDLETLNAIFRAAHSIKGGAGTFGFSDMAEVTHVLETLLDRLRKQELDPTVEMVDAFLQAGDVLKSQLQAHQEGEEYEDARVAEVCEHLERLARSDEGGGEAPVSSADQTESETKDTATHWRLAFAPAGIGQGTPGERQALFEALGELGRIQDLGDGESERCLWQLTSTAGRGAIEEILAFVCEPGQVQIDTVETPEASAETETETETAYGFFTDAPGLQGEASPDSAASAPEPDQDALGYGFFEGAPGTEQGTEERAEAPDATSTPDQPQEADFQAEAEIQESDGYGFFRNAPGSEAALDQEHRGYGLFGGSPGMERVAAVAQQDRLDDELGFGLFNPAPGSPESRADDEASAATGAAASTKSAPTRDGRAASGNAPKRPATTDSSIRVSVEKVDQLINLVGELVITHAMLADSAAGLDPVVHERIMGGLSNLERNSRDLQEAVMSIRMMPISFVFNRFPRVVRDTAASLGKKVTLKLVGEDTELDKGLIERMADPLNHLVRNSIDHGIERPEARLAAGKPETGEIVLRASHRGGSVVVEVSDDGGGLNREKLLAKAAKQGIPMPDNPPDKDVWQLIFHAGFSTAERVTDISGRGVGMDVVRRNIEDMNGRVEVDSTAGRGTHITIRLPLTLAILDGLSVRMGEEMFILPLTVIQESIQPRAEQFKTVVGKGRVAQINDEYLPMVSLHDVFNSGQPEPDPLDGILVIVETNEGRAAVLVDELVAQHQVVIKSLETNYRKVEGVSGATIMGDGRVALILDVDALVRLSRRGG
ncbi:chemotaxis protein CheW [Allochromatium humboldtianum]|uniref:Chemotaxis protein CheA n=1 Tax=Allochromatium humboldtianum TaxID=504901 RepID=A0A850RGZ6_9GAMM|nr:chemotaxis protein CheW [Allochromatium humboldtianum]NVZ08881.1 chemotaxis protein CheW [Allochromatium humboldtianum]